MSHPSPNRSWPSPLRPANKGVACATLHASGFVAFRGPIGQGPLVILIVSGFAKPRGLLRHETEGMRFCSHVRLLSFSWHMTRRPRNQGDCGLVRMMSSFDRFSSSHSQGMECQCVSFEEAFNEVTWNSTWVAGNNWTAFPSRVVDSLSICREL